MLPRYLYFALGLIGLIFVGNLVILDLFFVKQKEELLTLQTRTTQMSETIRLLGGRVAYTSATGSSSGSAVLEPFYGDLTCPQTCVSLIKMATISADLSRLTVSASVPVASTIGSSKGEFFIPLGSGSVLTTDGTSANWKTIDGAQATFDASNYTNIKTVYFEAFLRTATNGEVHARLFDSTTPQVFFNTDVKTTTNASTYLSAQFTAPTGSKVYKVQMYSTLSTGYLDQARIRIVTQ